MQVLTMDELYTIMLESAGAWNPAEHATEVADTAYPQLGYDSLALLEILIRIERAFGVSLPEDTVLSTETPRATLAAVNAKLSEMAGVR